MNTRGLQGMVINRIASESVSLVYPSFIDSDDGSAVIAEEVIISQASVGFLQPRDIERLEKAGIIIRNGLTIAIPQALENPPDKILYNNKYYRVIQWAITNENNNISVIATCDEMSISGCVMTTYRWQDTDTEEIFIITSDDDTYDKAETRTDYLVWANGRTVERIA